MKSSRTELPQQMRLPSGLKSMLAVGYSFSMLEKTYTIAYTQSIYKILKKTKTPCIHDIINMYITFKGAALGVDISQIAICPFSYLAAKILALTGDTTTEVTLLSPKV
jgi:hypothetical protein